MADQPQNGNGLGREVTAHDTLLKILLDEVRDLRSGAKEQSKPQWQTWFPAISLFLVLCGIALAPYISLLSKLSDRIDGLSERVARGEERALGNDNRSADRDHAQQGAIDGNMAKAEQMFSDMDLRIQREMELKDQITRLQAALEKKP